MPHGFVQPLSDLWPGDPEKGRWLCSGAFAAEGETLALHGNFWEPVGVGALWMTHMHGFDWLRDLKALGGDQARRQARDMAASWMSYYHCWHEDLWRPDLTGRRITNWISHYEFFGASADEDFQDEFFDVLVRQARHLSRTLPGTMHGYPLLQAIRGLIYAGIALQGRENWLVQGLDLLQQQTARQILADGGHVSRSPQILIQALQIYVEIRHALASAGYPVPAQIEQTIDRMAQAARFFRYTDKKMALFHGTQEGNSDMLDAVLTRSNARGKVLRSLPQSGFERMTLGRTLVMVDAGTPPAWPHDDHVHAAPLAFEMMYGKERIFVSCGTHPLDEDWRDSLRATAAHNTICLDNRNSAEIRNDGHMGRKPRKTASVREDNHDAVLLELSHDGYVPLNGVTHRRRLYLGRGGHDFRGEETLSCGVGVSRPIDVALRFHLHPRVQVSLIRDGQEALLRLPGGAGWRFIHSIGHIGLENSIYLGDGSRPRKTKQIVITGQMEQDVVTIKWALQRETK